MIGLSETPALCNRRYVAITALVLAILAMMRGSLPAIADHRADMQHKTELDLRRMSLEKAACNDAIANIRYAAVISACTVTALSSEKDADYLEKHVAYFNKIHDAQLADFARRNRDVRLVAAAEDWYLVILADSHQGKRADARRLACRTRALIASIHPNNLARTDVLERSQMVRRYRAIKVRLAAL